MKGFTKGKGHSRKFIPTQRKKQTPLTKDVIKHKSNNPIKEMKKAYKKHIDEKKKKKTLDEIVDAEVENRLEKLADDEDAYDDFLDNIGDMNQLVEDYGFARVLKETDPTAYRVGMSEWQDSQLSNMDHEINREAVSQAEEELEGHEEDKDYEEKLDDLISEKEDEIRQDKEDELDEEQYDDYLDEVGTGENEVLGTYSMILKEIDPTAYRVGMSDWTDGERERVEDEVRDEIDEDESIKAGEFVE